jgi:Co/Zn/Cd efflux system component
MSAYCCAHEQNTPETWQRDTRYRRVLWAVLGINAAMFLVEIVAGLAAGSVSLQADALDFLADAGNYGLSVFVVGMAFWRTAPHAFCNRECWLKTLLAGVFYRNS